LKYCEDLRIACFHAIHRDVGGRPGELLQLKLGDIKVDTVLSTGKKVCQFWIGEKGKTENSHRLASISDAIPFFNVWAHVHPAKHWDNPERAYLFPSLENKAKYRNVPLKPDSLRLCYVRVIEKEFPKLLDRPEIPLKDKVTLRSLIHDKPHYPYLRRHEFASEIAPRSSRQTFNQLMGHSPRSNLQDVYVQASGNEGVRELEIARGIRTREEMLSPAQIEI
jgi:integrase